MHELRFHELRLHKLGVQFNMQRAKPTPFGFAPLKKIMHGMQVQLGRSRCNTEIFEMGGLEAAANAFTRSRHRD